MLIVIEGLDGAGKSTQVRMLREWLSARCGSLEYIHFPRYDAPVYGELISRFLRGEYGSNDQVAPQIVALLYAEDRHGAAPMMKEALAAGKTLLLDRYVYSNIAYQCAKLPAGEAREDLREWINNTEFGSFDLPRPDVNIFLDVPIGFVESRLAASRTGSDRGYLEGGRDIHEASMDFQRSVREVYLRQCAVDPRFVRVDCSDEAGGMLPKEEIFGRIVSVVEPLL